MHLNWVGILLLTWTATAVFDDGFRLCHVELDSLLIDWREHIFNFSLMFLIGHKVL